MCVCVRARLCINVSSKIIHIYIGQADKSDDCGGEHSEKGKSETPSW